MLVERTDARGCYTEENREISLNFSVASGAGSTAHRRAIVDVSIPRLLSAFLHVAVVLNQIS